MGDTTIIFIVSVVTGISLILISSISEIKNNQIRIESKLNKIMDSMGLVDHVVNEEMLSEVHKLALSGKKLQAIKKYKLIIEQASPGVWEFFPYPRGIVL